MLLGGEFMETWLSPVGYQNGFTRAHAFQAGRDAPMAKFVYVGPRLALTGMSADEWIAAAPGSEGALALAMAHVIQRDRLAPVPADAARLRDVLASHAPERIASAAGIGAKGIPRLPGQLPPPNGGRPRARRGAGPGPHSCARGGGARDGAGVPEHHARGRRADEERWEAGQVQGPAPGPLAGAAPALRPGPRLRGVLGRRTATGRALHRGAGSRGAAWPAGRPGAQIPRSGRRTRIAWGGPADVDRIPVDRAARRARSEQTVAPRAARSSVEDHGARLGGQPPRDRGEMGRDGPVRGAAQVRVRGTARARLDHAGHPARRAGAG